MAATLRLHRLFVPSCSFFSMNRLDKTLSPYLLQHADNPVHWQPWDEAALAEARRRDAPILLSIGYSACHWCHVMAHESFEDDETAAIINEHFVSIKVDREERPDLDMIYQTANQILSKTQGGWPLTVFLTPDMIPFFSGTYFPDTPRHGMIDFKTCLRRIAEAWQSQREQIHEQNAHFSRLMQQLDAPVTAGQDEDIGILQDKTVDALIRVFDRENGGLGNAPKFPHPVELSFCLQYVACRAQDSRAGTLQSLLQLTLARMMTGGIVDHVGGGFFRYSVDAHWMIPHFEKMLYDNAQLVDVYTRAHRLFDDVGYAGVVDRTVRFLIRELYDEKTKLFYSALDADSEGGEGTFYLWSGDELQRLLSQGEDAAHYDLFAAHFGLGSGENFEGKHHLVRRQTVAQTAAITGQPPIRTEALLNQMCESLLEHRAHRSRPHTDRKILVSWNGLAIQALANAAWHFNRPDWATLAEECFLAIKHDLWKQDRLHGVFYQGDISPSQGFLDDYAFLLAGGLALLRHGIKPDLFAFCKSLADGLCRDFYDADNGGFFFSSHSGEKLIRRPKPIDDNVIPSGNAVAIDALAQMSWLTHEVAYHQAATRSVAYFSGMINKHGMQCTRLLGSATERTYVLLVGADPLLLRQYRERIDQSAEVLSFIMPQVYTHLLPMTQSPASDGVRLLVCRGTHCMAATDDIDTALQHILDGETGDDDEQS